VLALTVHFQIGGVSSFVEDIGKKNCNRDVRNKLKQHMPFRKNINKGMKVTKLEARSAGRQVRKNRDVK
jgi:hypothetical protein